MFSFLRKESVALQLYGKLPLAKDYLRIGCGQGAGAAWIICCQFAWYLRSCR